MPSPGPFYKQSWPEFPLRPPQPAAYGHTVNQAPIGRRQVAPARPANSRCRRRLACRPDITMPLPLIDGILPNDEALTLVGNSVIDVAVEALRNNVG